MDTKNTLHFDPTRLARFAEVAAYAGLATVLISQAFYSDDLITTQDAGLVMLGAIFGLLASCAAAPLFSLFGHGGDEDRQMIDVVRTRSYGDALPFKRQEHRGEPIHYGKEPRRAA